MLMVDFSLATAGLTTALPYELNLPTVSGFTDGVAHVSAGGGSVCISGFVWVNASTDANVKFDYQLPSNQIDLTQTFVSLWSAGADFRSSITTGFQLVGGDFRLGATLCLPPDYQASRIQVLTHGIGFDRRYWDLAPGYSYVDSASQAGYATFLYDRLGVGESSIEDPLNTIQSPIELAILEGLLAKLRSGALGVTSYDTVVGVGHSFGSALTQGVAAAAPSLLDAVVLTGFSVNASGMPAFSLGQNAVLASINEPERFGNLSSGFVVIGTAVSNQNTFFHSPGFDPALLALADHVKGTVTLGEFFTTGATIKPAMNYSGPVVVVAGNEDLGFCSGNCSYPTNLLAEVPVTLFPNTASNRTSTYRAADSGHGLNFHYSSVEAFEHIQQFLKTQGV
ncbi:hypothetical protein CLIM01_14904 [Colletotrichum limetticola]|uniref:AB hydrolase-1 domain-containing protein n=1 Tax=Colletotrichum limetticola TaxID=1209924 RepID=A0ABQ9PCY9_9PEZI|nr:hypothetical protein CLIM01_14904 [Colletotrichum limetticola]